MMNPGEGRGLSPIRRISVDPRGRGWWSLIRRIGDDPQGGGGVVADPPDR